MLTVKQQKMMNWLNESNRMEHLIGVFVVSLIGTALMGIGCIGGMEFKDCHHDARNYGLPMDRWTWRQGS